MISITDPEQATALWAAAVFYTRQWEPVSPAMAKVITSLHRLSDAEFADLLSNAVIPNTPMVNTLNEAVIRADRRAARHKRRLTAAHRLALLEDKRRAK